MVLFTKIIFLSLFLKGALSSTSEKANLYLDTLLSDLLPNAVRALNLDPAPVSSTNVTVPSTGFTNHDLRVVLTNIRLHGLASRLRRRGDCNEPAWKGASLTTSCYVSLDGLRLSYDASARGFDWLGSRVKFAFQAVLSKANAYIDVTSAFGGHATLKTLRAPDLKFKVTQDRRINLNPLRQRTLEGRIAQISRLSLVNVLQGKFKEAFNDALAMAPFPGA
ncbi:uncharacterized protein LOC8023395 [Ixodes scapularis]|uniref:uncharacterized protein LOC8023395 n=1 Tax=Ixodes scapularis TaxID=6945 RepID=UPI001A9E7887|nr:uncharacterized protein LOC8023395 [Ixodes scapularis]